jgi:HK97 family phage major capsid protein
MPLVSYTFQSDVGANKAGDVVQLEQDQAEPLVAAGLLAESTVDDINNGGADKEPDGDEVAPEQLAIQRSISEGFKKLSKTFVDNLKQTQPNHVPASVAVGNYAQVKEQAIKSIGDLCKHQYRAKVLGNTESMNRLRRYEQEVRQKSPAGQAEGTNSLGGYAVIPEWADEIFKKVKNLPKLLDMCKRVPISGSTYNIPAIDETSLVDSYRGGGIRSYWVGEGSTATESHTTLTQVQAVVKTNVVMVPFTNQFLEDNSYNFDSYVNEIVGEELVWEEDRMVISGAGTTQPTGIMNQASLVTISKESGQSAATIVFPNLTKMFARLYPASRVNAVWLANPQVYSQLVAMTFPNASGTYSAFGHLAYNSHDEFPMRIFGKPVIECLMCPDLGNAGDLILCDLKQLVCAEKPGIDVAISTDVYFSSLQTVYRFCRRYDIISPWTGALTDYNNHYTYSGFVTLQTRGT